MNTDKDLTVIDIEAGKEPTLRTAGKSLNLTDEAIDRILEDMQDGGYTERRKENGTF